jgi:hypothetical protein
VRLVEPLRAQSEKSIGATMGLWSHLEENVQRPIQHLRRR